MALLDRIQDPADLRQVPTADLPLVAEEIRRLILEVLSVNGGHLASGLGVVELTIALHYVYDFARDAIVWDVGHQCYPHKLLTGRAATFHTLRSKDGVSGYPHPAESPADVMRSGHAGTAISMGLGIAAADGVEGRDRDVVCVVGDSGLGAGVGPPPPPQRPRHDRLRCRYLAPRHVRRAGGTRRRAAHRGRRPAPVRAGAPGGDGRARVCRRG